jgi:hypothetical protein
LSYLVTAYTKIIRTLIHKTNTDKNKQPHYRLGDLERFDHGILEEQMSTRIHFLQTFNLNRASFLSEGRESREDIVFAMSTRFERAAAKKISVFEKGW